MFGSPGFCPRLVRRTATVTISAPLAAMARAVSSMSLYLPVPTSRRESYSLPAMMRRSVFGVALDMRVIRECSPNGLMETRE